MRYHRRRRRSSERIVERTLLLKALTAPAYRGVVDWTGNAAVASVRARHQYNHRLIQQRFRARRGGRVASAHAPEVVADCGRIRLRTTDPQRSIEWIGGSLDQCMRKHDPLN